MLRVQRHVYRPEIGLVCAKKLPSNLVKYSGSPGYANYWDMQN